MEINANQQRTTNIGKMLLEILKSMNVRSNEKKKESLSKHICCQLPFIQSPGSYKQHWLRVMNHKPIIISIWFLVPGPTKKILRIINSSHQSQRKWRIDKRKWFLFFFSEKGVGRQYQSCQCILEMRMTINFFARIKYSDTAHKSPLKMTKFRIWSIPNSPFIWVLIAFLKTFRFNFAAAMSCS